MRQFAGGVVAVTGGASGFGKEFAKIGVGLGMKLVLADIQQNALDAAAAEFPAQGVEVIGLHVDMSKVEDVQALADVAIKTFGKINLLSNNAGVGVGGLVQESSECDWDWVFGVNLHDVIYGVRVFTPLMLEATKKDPLYEGHIVNTTSMAGPLNAPAMGTYNVSKHAVVALSESLYQDLSLVTEQIHRSVLCPYFVPAGITRSDRNRPQDLANTAPPTKSQLISRAMSEKAVSSGKVTAEQAGQMTFGAIRSAGFYIYSHPHTLAPVQHRFEDIISQCSPSDPSEDKPDVHMRLIDALRG